MTLGLIFMLGLFCLPGWSRPVLDGNLDAEEVARKVFPSVVRVEAVNGMRKVATGVVMDKKGHIITTALIGPRDEGIFVINSKGDRVKAELLGMDPVTHLAVVKAAEMNWVPVSMGKPSDLSPGSWIGVISMTTENAPAITQGIVSSIDHETLRLNVWLMPGASGSPVVDKNGRMVGLIRGTYSGQVTFSLGSEEMVRGMVFSRAEAPSSGLAMACPVDIVERVGSEIKEKGKVDRGWLGISIADRPEGEVTVISVAPDSPAEQAGLKRGDVILEVSGRKITSSALLVHEIRMRRPGDEANFKIRRNGKERAIDVELGEYSRRQIRDEFAAKFPSLFSSAKTIQKLQEAVPPGRFFIPGRGNKYIGVSLQEMSPELAEYFGAEEGTGLLVSKIAENSPADEAGVKVGDVIVQADDIKIDEYDKLFHLIQAKDEGDTVRLTILRDKKPLTLKVKVAVNPGRESRFSSFRYNRGDRTAVPLFFINRSG